MTNLFNKLNKNRRIKKLGWFVGLMGNCIFIQGVNRNQVNPDNLVIITINSSTSLDVEQAGGSDADREMIVKIISKINRKINISQPKIAS